MPAMNISLQRRIGKLPRTPETSYGQSTIFGNTHRGFGLRMPTPTGKGFFGLGGSHNSDTSGGDGGVDAWYGGSESLKNMPVPGVYGIGNAPSSIMKTRPTHWNTPGLFGTVEDSLVKHQTLAALLGLGMVMYMLK